MSLNTSNAIRILLIHDTQNDAEPLSNAIRNSGQAVRSHFIASLDELNEVIEEQSWDMMIAKLNTSTIDATEAVANIQRDGKDIPMIGIIEDYNQDIIVSALDMGMADVIVESSIQHLTQVVKREFNALLGRRELRSQRVSLRDTEKRCQLLLESSVDAIGYVHEGMHIFANSVYMKMFGYEDIEELQCTPIMDLVSGAEVNHLKAALKAFKEGRSSDVTTEGLHSDGSNFKIRMEFSDASYEGEPCTQIIIRKNSESSTELEEKLKVVRTLDAVTGFHNKQHFDELLQKTYQQVLTSGKRQIVAHIGIANFSEIKSTVSIAGTDTILKQVSEKLKEASDNQSENVARYSDDMFTAIESTHDIALVQDYWAKIQQQVADHLFDVDGKTVKVNLVCGFAHIDESCASGNEALVQADQAFNQALKEKKRQVYFDKSDIANLADNSIVNKIKHALEHDGLRIQFQPIMSLRGDSKEHYDILTRLQDKDGSDISPSDFLPSIENSELSGKLDRWVVKKSIESLAEHLTHGHHTQIMIHLTAASIQDPTFLPWVNSELKRNNVPGDSICFQMAEKIAHNYLKAAKAFSKGLSLLKCQLSVNHFGLFENGMELTSHLDISYARVDASFVDRMVEGDKAATDQLSNLLRSVHQNDINSIVPKIENAEVLSSLWEMGVNYIQGYYLQAPLDDMAYNFESDEEAV